MSDQTKTQEAIPIEALSLDQLKAVAFDIDEDIKVKTSVLENVKSRINFLKEQMIKQNENQVKKEGEKTD